jgi:hypothetical protein
VVPEVIARRDGAMKRLYIFSVMKTIMLPQNCSSAAQRLVLDSGIIPFYHVSFTNEPGMDDTMTCGRSVEVLNFTDDPSHTTGIVSYIIVVGAHHKTSTIMMIQGFRPKRMMASILSIRTCNLMSRRETV